MGDNNLSEVINPLEAESRVLEHLASCDYQISGYRDESDHLYKNIILPRPLSPQLIRNWSSFKRDKRRLHLTFTLNLETVTPPLSIAELMLVYDDNRELIDEKWQVIDLNSEFIQVQPPAPIQQIEGK